MDWRVDAAADDNSALSRQWERRENSSSGGGRVDCSCRRETSGQYCSVVPEEHDDAETIKKRRVVVV